MRGVDKGHSRDVGIGLCSHIEPASARSFDHGEALRRVAQARAVDVHDVQRRARDGGCSDHFAHRFNR
jgi:hypothetical protein